MSINTPPRPAATGSSIQHLSCWTSPRKAWQETHEAGGVQGCWCRWSSCFFFIINHFPTFTLLYIQVPSGCLVVSRCFRFYIKMTIYSENQQMNFTAFFMLQQLKTVKASQIKNTIYTHTHVYTYVIIKPLCQIRTSISVLPSLDMGHRPPLWRSHDHNVGYMGRVSWARQGSEVGLRNQSL